MERRICFTVLLEMARRSADRALVSSSSESAAVNFSNLQGSKVQKPGIQAWLAGLAGTAGRVGGHGGPGLQGWRAGSGGHLGPSRLAWRAGSAGMAGGAGRAGRSGPGARRPGPPGPSCLQTRPAKPAYPPSRDDQLGYVSATMPLTRPASYLPAFCSSAQISSFPVAAV